MPVFGAAYLIIEALAFVLLGVTLGWGWALLTVAVTFVLGLFLATWQLKSLTRRVASQADNPGRLTADAALSVVGALLVALPGFVSTVIGILFLLPPTRGAIRAMLGAAGRRALVNLGSGSFTTVTRFGAPASRDIPGWGEVIDHREGEVRESRSGELRPGSEEPGR